MKSIFLNGNIHTLDRQISEAAALVVDGGKIILMGDSRQAKKLKQRGDQVFDLKNHTVIPGLVDSHVHFVYWAETRSQLDLENARSTIEVQKKVAAFEKRLPDGPWLLGSNFNKNLWPAVELPDKKILDAVCPRRPVVLASKDVHTIWLNSAALTVVGITSSTPDPPGGKIVRYPGSQEPTGYLLETACRLVNEYLEKNQKKPDMEKVVLAAQKEAWKQGLTGIHALPDPGFEKSFPLLERLTREEKLRLRILMYIPEKRLDWAIELGLQSGFGNDFFKVGGVKIFVDGALGSQTALLFEPYEGNSSTGMEVSSPSHLENQLAKTARANLACAVHAIGDKAVFYALEAFGKTLPIHKGRLRQRIEHVQLIRDEDVPKFKKYKVAASMQPSHAPSDRYIADKHWGARCRNAYPWHSLLKAGALLAFGSDAPVEPLEPLAGIYSAVCRKNPEEEKNWYPYQAVSIGEAIRGFTVAPAILSGDEHKRGTLTPGKLADFIVLSEDPFKVSPERLAWLEVLATIVESEVVYAQKGTGLGL
ncbi:MAG TPA: amidohydrolase [candidate division Zixibacteria bacterium]|nr:amidohydrolase [candidate division Zixibacteria bacterium]